ncbi:hypothetical protein AMTR_s00072p00155120, partial [Amborella trichopoda]
LFFYNNCGHTSLGLTVSTPQPLAFFPLFLAIVDHPICGDASFGILALSLLELLLISGSLHLYFEYPAGGLPSSNSTRLSACLTIVPSRQLASKDFKSLVSR